MKRTTCCFCVALALFAPVACAIHVDMAEMAEAKAEAQAAGEPQPVLFAAKR